MKMLLVGLVAVTAAACARSGPPYAWACTPANFASAGSSNASMFVYNGSASTANVAVNFLNKDGANLAGVAVPGAAGATYPGQAGTSTVPLQANHTLVVDWHTAQGIPGNGGDVAATIRVVSDQPIVVGSNVEFSGYHPMTCGYLHP